MTIDKKFPGLERISDTLYRLRGNLITDENLEIAINIIVTGVVQCKGNFGSPRDFQCDGYVYCGEDFWCGGNLLCRKNLQCNGDFWCNGDAAHGNIQCYGELRCDGDFWCTENIECYGDIWCYGNLRCDRRIWSYGNFRCRGNLLCGGGFRCDGNFQCDGDIWMQGVKTKSLLFLHGTPKYRVLIMDTHIKIGCRLKSKAEWLTVTEDQARDLGDDGSVWAMRELLVPFCKTVD